MVVTATTAFADDYGWFDGSMIIGGAETDPTRWSTSDATPTDIGTVSNMTITSITFKVWCNANDRSHAYMYFRIFDEDKIQIGTDDHIVIDMGNSNWIGGDYGHDYSFSWTGTLDLAAAVGLTTLVPDKTYYIDMWAMTEGDKAKEQWLSAGGANYHAKLTIASIALTDGNDLSALSSSAGKTCYVSYSRSFANGATSTVCLPFDYTKKSGDGSFYAFTNIVKDGNEYVATMTDPGTTTLTANTPYLYTPNSNNPVDFSGTYTLPASITAGETTSNGWTFKGTYETITWDGTQTTPTYGFSAQNTNDGITQGQFVKVGEYVRIKPMRCYLEKSSSGARGMTRAADEELPETIKVRLISANGEVTAIGSLKTKTGEVTFDKDAWYSLDGRLIEGKPSKSGLYINNGKKVIIK